MTDVFKKINNFPKRWFYQQITYLKFMWKSFTSFFSHFPFGYINLFIQLIFATLMFPIYLGQALEFWVASMSIFKPTMEDVGGIKDSGGRTAVAKAQIRAIDEYKGITKTVITFFLGIITAFLTLYLTQTFFSN